MIKLLIMYVLSTIIDNLILFLCGSTVYGLFGVPAFAFIPSLPAVASERTVPPLQSRACIFR